MRPKPETVVNSHAATWTMPPTSYESNANVSITDMSEPIHMHPDIGLGRYSAKQAPLLKASDSAGSNESREDCPASQEGANEWSESSWQSHGTLPWRSESAQQMLLTHNAYLRSRQKKTKV